MYQHLVVAVDGSQTSVNALKHASDLALSNQARLTLVTVANPSEYMTLAPDCVQYDSYEAAAVAGGNEVLAEAAALARSAGVSDVCTHLLVTAKGAKEMAKELVEYSGEQGADLIVIGTHGRSGLMHLLMGSFAETVMRESHLPLLVVRNQAVENT